MQDFVEFLAIDVRLFAESLLATVASSDGFTTAALLTVAVGAITCTFFFWKVFRICYLEEEHNVKVLSPQQDMVQELASFLAWEVSVYCLETTLQWYILLLSCCLPLIKITRLILA